MIDELPEGWETTTLGELLRVNYGKALKGDSRTLGHIAVFGSGGVVGSHIEPLVNRPCIVIGRKGSIGSVFWSAEPCWPIDTTYYIDEFGPFDSGYLVRLLKSIDLKSLDSSTALPGLNRDDLYGVVVLLPPLAEQRRIVAKIEELTARSRAARAALAEVPTLLEQFRQSVLASAFRGDLTADWRSKHPNTEPASVLLDRIRAERRKQWEAKYPKKKYVEPDPVDDSDLPELPEGWCWCYLPELGYMNRGKSRHRPRNAPELFGGPYPFVQTGDVAQSGGRITSHTQTYSELGLNQSRLWPAGTMCITIAANIASSAILTYPACFPDSVVGLIPDEELCPVAYAEYFLRTARSDLEQFAPATAQRNINIGILNELAVPLAPREEQTEIVRQLDSAQHRVERIKLLITEAESELVTADQSILAKAFRGELVTQDPADEPPSVLLERIRASQAEVTPDKPRRGRRKDTQ